MSQVPVSLFEQRLKKLEAMEEAFKISPKTLRVLKMEHAAFLDIVAEAKRDLLERITRQCWEKTDLQILSEWEGDWFGGESP